MSFPESCFDTVRAVKPLWFAETRIQAVDKEQEEDTIGRT
jgi:hypothetical protein